MKLFFILFICSLFATNTFANSQLKPLYSSQASDSRGTRVVEAQIFQVPSKKSPGQTNLILSLDYFERSHNAEVRPCTSPTTPVYAVFIIAFKGDQMRPVAVPMNPVCQQGDRRANLYISQEDLHGLWDQLFPQRVDGTRWYAMQLAFTGHASLDSHFPWDSNFGENYRLILSP